MAEFKIISPLNSVMLLNENDYFYLIDIDGQTMFNTTVSSNVSSGYDGSTVNSIIANPRSLIITLYIKQGIDVEDALAQIIPT